MQDQPKYKPQRPSDFFADGRSERQPVEGTIARGALNEDTAFYEGKDAAGKDIEAFPIAVDKTVIRARPAAVRHLLRALPWPRSATVWE